MKVVAIVQARMGSTRLPGKALMDLAGEPMLVRVVNRTRRAATLDEVVVATTTQPADEAIARLCAARKWPCFRGSEDDVLDRYYRAALECRADVVVRITSDCPFIEPSVVDNVVREFMRRQPEAAYVSNVHPLRTFPRGLDTEVMKFAALERAWNEDKNPAWREHVTEYLLQHPDLFRIHGVTNDRDYSHMRWTVDEAEDLAFARRVYDHFGHDRFSWLDVLGALVEHPDWMDINSAVKQKVV